VLAAVICPFLVCLFNSSLGAGHFRIDSEVVNSFANDQELVRGLENPDKIHTPIVDLHDWQGPHLQFVQAMQSVTLSN
jgi:hypothetical protein